MAGIDLPGVDSACQMSRPVSVTVTVTSQPGFNILTGGNLAGTYTIPPFATCGPQTPPINPTVPGADNTIVLTLGNGRVIP